MELASLVIAISAAALSAVVAVGAALMARQARRVEREFLLKALNMEREAASRLVEVALSIQNRSDQPLHDVSMDLLTMWRAWCGPILVPGELREEVRRSVREAVYDATGGESAWFWQRAWQEGEREADLEIARGEGIRFDSDDEFESFLRDQPAADDPAHAENKV